MKMTGEGKVSSMHLDSSFGLKLRVSRGRGRGQEVSLLVGAPRLDGAQLIPADGQDVNLVKMESSAVCRLRLFW